MSAAGAAAAWQITWALIALEVIRRTGASNEDALFAAEQAVIPFADEDISALVILQVVDAATELIDSPSVSDR